MGEFYIESPKSAKETCRKVKEEVESVKFCITDSRGSLLSKKEAEIFLKGLLGDDYSPGLVHN